MKITLKKRKKILGMTPWQPWYFTLTADNGEPIAQSEQYANRQDAINTMLAISHDAASAHVDLSA